MFNKIKERYLMSVYQQLFDALQNSNLTLVKAIVEKDVDTCVNAKDSFGMTALMYVAALGDQEMCQYLLDRGAEVDAQDSLGWTALMHAAYNNCVGVIPVFKSVNANTQLKNEDRDNAWSIAYFSGHKRFADAVSNKSFKRTRTLKL